MPDFLDNTINEIRDRLNELRPLVEEFQRLEAAEQALAGVDGSDASPSPAPSARPSTSTKTGPKRSRSGRRGRPKGGGSRATQALELVRERPGITISELAEAMGIQQNYLYRVMPDLAEQRLVTKSGRGWHARTPAGTTGETEPAESGPQGDGETTDVGSASGPADGDDSPNDAE